MKKPNLIEARNARTAQRKLRKKEYDDIITLSTASDGNRLLDEGMVVDAYGYPLFYIMKGTLEKYLDALSDDYVGSINLGHMEFATFPFLLGTWTKKDLHLVDIGDGRKGLDVEIHLDQESFLVKELKRMNYDLGISAEFSYKVNKELSEQYGLEIMDEIFITDFAVVGEAGNVNSSKVTLGEKSMTVEELMARLNNAEKKNLNLKDLTEALDALAVSEEAPEAPAEESPEAIEEVTETVAEEATEEPETAVEEAEETEVTEEAAEESTEESTEESAEETAEEASEEESLDLAAILNELQETVRNLNAEIESLRGERDAAREALSIKENEEKDFFEKFKALTVISTKETPKPVERKSAYTDGIGE